MIMQFNYRLYKMKRLGFQNEIKYGKYSCKYNDT